MMSSVGCVSCEPTVRYRCSGGLARLLWLHKGENEQPLIVNNKVAEDPVWRGMAAAIP